MSFRIKEPLKHCPICCRPAMYRYGNKSWNPRYKKVRACCTACGISTYCFTSEKEAADVWNRRVKR